MNTKDKRRAREITRAAILNGTLARPTVCEDCSEDGTTYAHHADYSRPLVVEWLCRTCHGKRHIGDQKGRSWRQPATAVDSPHVGNHEAAEMIGVSRQRVHQYAEEAKANGYPEGSFPRPTDELRAGRIWRRADVQRWINQRQEAKG